MRIRSEPRERGPFRRGGGTPDAERPLPDDPRMAKRRLLATLVESAAGTQQDLSDALDISYATLHAWRTGRREVPDEALEGMGRLAVRRGRVLMETGSRLLRLAGSDEQTRPKERDEPRPSAEIRTSARAMRQRSAETTERVRESLERTRDVPPR